MIIKNEYTIEELAAISAKERVEISIDISPDNTSINIYPYEKSSNYSGVVTVPYYNPSYNPSYVTCDTKTSPLPKTVDVTCSSNTETEDKNGE